MLAGTASVVLQLCEAYTSSAYIISLRHQPSVDVKDL